MSCAPSTPTRAPRATCPPAGGARRERQAHGRHDGQQREADDAWMHDEKTIEKDSQLSFNNRLLEFMRQIAPHPNQEKRRQLTFTQQTASRLHQWWCPCPPCTWRWAISSPVAARTSVTLQAKRRALPASGWLPSRCTSGPLILTT